jgi:hypothetical protein
MPWQAKPGCLEHHRVTVERMVNALPSSYLLLPRTGELFDSLDTCNSRLRGYALAEGFDTVKHGGGTKERAQPGNAEDIDHAHLDQPSRFDMNRLDSALHKVFDSSSANDEIENLRRLHVSTTLFLTSDSSLLQNTLERTSNSS